MRLYNNRQINMGKTVYIVENVDDTGACAGSQYFTTPEEAIGRATEMWEQMTESEKNLYDVCVFKAEAPENASEYICEGYAGDFENWTFHVELNEIWDGVENERKKREIKND